VCRLSVISVRDAAADSDCGTLPKVPGRKIAKLTS